MSGASLSASFSSPTTSPPSPSAATSIAANGTCSGSSTTDSKKPFRIRAELLAPSRLAPKVQLLHYSRSLATQVVAHECLLLALACAKSYTAAGKDPPRVGILGGGNVGCAIVMTLLANGYHASRITISTRQPDRIPRCEALKAPSALSMFQLVPRYYDNARAARESDILVLCTPPPQLKSVAIQIRHALAANVDAPPLVVSTLCGVTRQSLSKACSCQNVVRVQPDVVKIASLWHEQEEPGAAPNECAAPHSQGERNLAQEATERNRLLLPLQLAAHALAPQHEDVLVLLQVLTALCSRVLDQENQDARCSAASLLFGDRSEAVMAALAEGDEMQRQQEEKKPRTLVVPSWPAEWEQDLAELQAHLAQTMLSG